MHADAEGAASTGAGGGATGLGSRRPGRGAKAGGSGGDRSTGRPGDRQAGERSVSTVISGGEPTRAGGPQNPTPRVT